MKRICVFCGSSPGSRPEYRAAAEELGAELARRGTGLVYGGGNVGLMGVLADAVLRAGGEAVGVIPKHLMAREVGHNGLTKLHVVRSMHERKALMADLSDAFVAMPGGYGTLEEFCEIVTWAQLGLHAKPCGILNVLRGCPLPRGNLNTWGSNSTVAPLARCQGRRVQATVQLPGCRPTGSDHTLQISNVNSAWRRESGGPCRARIPRCWRV